MVRSELEMPAAQAAGAGLSGGRRAVWRQAVRALFVSDVHLGSPHACAEEFLALLNSYDPQRLYLVGDIVDGRRLRKRWHWPEIYNQILARMTEILDRGGQVFYTPGNHDEFIREILPHLPPLFRTDRFCIADEFLYESKLGARMLVTHGDQFDRHEQAAGWVSRLVTIAYDWLLHIDNWQTEWRAGRWGGGGLGGCNRALPRASANFIPANRGGGGGGRGGGRRGGRNGWSRVWRGFYGNLSKLQSVMRSAAVTMASFAVTCMSRRLSAGKQFRIVMPVTGSNIALP